MTSPVNFHRRDPVNLRGTSGAKPSAGDLATSAMSAVAGHVTAALAQALQLAGREGAGQGGHGRLEGYGIDELANELADGAAASPSERGQIARALNDFVCEGAALFVARPESGSLEQLQSAIGDGGTGGSLSLSEGQQVIAAIDRATTRIAGTAR